MRKEGMTLDDFREATKKLPGTTLISIRGDIPYGIEVVPGRTSEGYYNPQFNEANKGREQAIVFTKFCERSDGVVEETRI